MAYTQLHTRSMKLQHMHIFKLPLLYSIACQSVYVQRIRLCTIRPESHLASCFDSRAFALLPNAMVSNKASVHYSNRSALERMKLTVLGKYSWRALLYIHVVIRALRYIQIIVEFSCATWNVFLMIKLLTFI